MLITSAQAQSWLDSGVSDILAAAGFLPSIVGSVANKGESAHDLDILLRATEPLWSLENQIDAFQFLAPKLGLIDLSPTPVEAAGFNDRWFLSASLPNGWLVEFYFIDLP